MYESIKMELDDLKKKKSGADERLEKLEGVEEEKRDLLQEKTGKNRYLSKFLKKLLRRKSRICKGKFRVIKIQSMDTSKI